MAEDRYQHTVDGLEVNETDINLIATEAALADDRVFAELLRMAPSGRGVLPSSHNQATPAVSAIIVPSGSADSTIVINPFRALVALPGTGGLSLYREIRSALCIADSVGEMRQFLQLPAAPTNNRWSLIYVRVDVEIDGVASNRFTKTTTAAATAQLIVTTKKTTCTLGMAHGAEAASPTKPTIPADSGSSYYIPLAYVLVLSGHTLSTAISKLRIDEVAPVLQLSRATGAASLRVATGNWKEGGAVLTNETWTVATGRPKGFMPPTMGGKEEVMIALQELATPRTVTLGTTAILDDSTDWRGRVCEVICTYSTTDFGWVSGGVFPGPGVETKLLVAQTVVGAAGKANLATLNNSNTSGTMAAGSTLALYVDMADGKIKVDMGATAPGCNFFFIVKGSGKHDNAV